MEWQPIETAGEKDFVILGYTKSGSVGIFIWDGDEFVPNNDDYNQRNDRPTHWIAIPDSPA